MSVLVNIPSAPSYNASTKRGRRVFQNLNSISEMDNTLLQQAANVIPQQSYLVVPVPVGTGQRSLSLVTNQTHNNTDIIGLKIRVADAADTSFSMNGNKLADATIINCGFLKIYNGNTKILESMPLSSLIPLDGQSYVPVKIDVFTPGSSEVVLTNAALTTSVPRDIEIILVRKENNY